MRILRIIFSRKFLYMRGVAYMLASTLFGGSVGMLPYILRELFSYFLGGYFRLALKLLKFLKIISTAQIYGD